MRILSLFCVLLLGACVSTPQYRDVSKLEGEVNPRDVNFQLFSPFYHDPPDCVVVLDSKAGQHPETGRMISVALARYLGEKVDRVIFPRHRQRIEKREGYDLETQADLKRFSYAQKCRYSARAELYDLGDEYLGVFAKKHVGVRLDLIRISDNKPIWQAAHTVWRADGAAPLNPLSALGGMASATMFSQDQEVMPSLIDDAMRRMLRTLPQAG